MEWLTNEVLFYAGISITAASLIMGAVYFVVSRFRALRLKTQLTAEYGEPDN